MRREALIGMLLAPALAAADTIDATLTTLVSGRQDPRDGQVHTVVPAYELVSIRASEVNNPLVGNLSLVLLGWGALDLGEVRQDGRASGDLDLAFAEGRIGERLSLRAGRQLVNGGAARMSQLDGVSAQLHIWEGLGVSAYGGAPVTPRFGTSRGDAMAGTRLWWRHALQTEAGASFVHVLDNGRTARQDVGLDLRYAPHPGVVLTGSGLWSTAAGRLAEADLSLAWRPWFAPAEISLDWRRTAPDLFLSAASIFSVFSEEQRDEAGGELYWRPAPAVALSGGYHLIAIEEGRGHRGAGRLSLFLRPGSTVGVELRRLALPRNGYLQARLYGLHRASEALSMTLEADGYFLDEPLNGQTLSLTAALTAGYEISPRWRAVLSGLAGATPFFERRLEVMARLVYNQTLRVRQEEEAE